MERKKLNVNSYSPVSEEVREGEGSWGKGTVQDRTLTGTVEGCWILRSPQENMIPIILAGVGGHSRMFSNLGFGNKRQKNLAYSKFWVLISGSRIKTQTHGSNGNAHV